ncbi:MAG: YihY/virulence factor BrkB family protein [Lachnospiraceae bacterium]|nr:YihY/virulence factor BrkB family protein [Candidatus Equihabitans merdae]
MIRSIVGNISYFGERLRKDHVGAYATTCAFFLMLSFVPLIMIVMAIISRSSIDDTMVMNVIISVCPAGIRDYISAIIEEVYSKSFAIVPISVVILIWSASKVIFALTLSMNVINKVSETRQFIFLRLRSMLMILFLIIALVLVAFLHSQSLLFTDAAGSRFPAIAEMVQVFAPFGKLIGYFLLVVIFWTIYTFFPNKRQRVSSQFPGALLVATVWVILSYFLTLYYSHTTNFKSIYGSLTGMVLAMMWLYFCMYFLLAGAEINQIILENPEDNMIVKTIEEAKQTSALKQETLRREVMEQKRRAAEEVFNTNEIVPEVREEGHDYDDETGIDLSLIRQGFYQNEDIMEGEDE